MRPHRPYINIPFVLRGVTFNVCRCNDTKKFIVVLAMIFAIALLAQPKTQAGVFFRFGLPIPIPVPVFYGQAYYPGGYYYGPYGYAHYPRPYWRHRYWSHGHWCYN
jgi:hypothetical protein